jgi:hypothetical protein
MSRTSNHLGNEEIESSQIQDVNMECIENEETYRNLIALVSGAIVNRQFDYQLDDTLDQVYDMSYLKERTNDNIFDQEQLNSLGLDSIGNISDIPTIKNMYESNLFGPNSICRIRNYMQHISTRPCEDSLERGR